MYHEQFLRHLDEEERKKKEEGSRAKAQLPIQAKAPAPSLDEEAEKESRRNHLQFLDNLNQRTMEERAAKTKGKTTSASDDSNN
jgi:hypothetical protein